MITTNKDDLKRPELLKVLCILTFIGSGISLFSYTVLALFLDFFRSIASQEAFTFLQSEEEKNMLIMMLSLPSIYFIIHAILYALSIFGAYLMWNLRKTGFHFYAIAQILLLIVYKAFIPDSPFPYFPITLTIIFILLYYRNLQFMR